MFSIVAKRIASNAVGRTRSSGNLLGRAHGQRSQPQLKEKLPLINGNFFSVTAKSGVNNSLGISAGADGFLKRIKRINVFLNRGLLGWFVVLCGQEAYQMNRDKASWQRAAKLLAFDTLTIKSDGPIEARRMKICFQEDVKDLDLTWFGMARITYNFLFCEDHVFGVGLARGEEPEMFQLTKFTFPEMEELVERDVVTRGEDGSTITTRHFLKPDGEDMLLKAKFDQFYGRSFGFIVIKKGTYFKRILFPEDFGGLFGYEIELLD